MDCYIDHTGTVCLCQVGRRLADHGIYLLSQLHYIDPDTEAGQQFLDVYDSAIAAYQDHIKSCTRSVALGSGAKAVEEVICLQCHQQIEVMSYPNPRQSEIEVAF